MTGHGRSSTRIEAIRRRGIWSSTQNRVTCAHARRGLEIRRSAQCKVGSIKFEHLTVQGH